jgi:hypothetical protein
MKTTVIVTKNEKTYLGNPVVTIQIFNTKRLANVFINLLQKEEFAKDFIITVK